MKFFSSVIIILFFTALAMWIFGSVKVIIRWLKLRMKNKSESDNV